ncbi:MAG: hypothetical protein PHE04_01855 [Bacteroidales bacterium]|nr:hypothetical protein [Bacteroidales bacterium]MDD3430447.1 hypothetical protein [Bacteroidales bacterium]MDD4361633.1 hypothetical protein [Bacteroidales bacterium]MDD4430233.1 hypothetical protein [Bacteroidales bacterium]
MSFFISFGQKRSRFLPAALCLCLVLLSVKVSSSEVYVSESDNLLLNTGFEIWEDNMPADWFGSASSIPEASVFKSSEAHSGESSCRLVRTQKSHVRFSSSPMTLSLGAYRFSYYVKGSGCIRNSFYNGSSYATYSDYDTLSNQQEWKKKVYEFELKKDAELQMLFSLCLTDSIGLFIDDVLFESIPADLEHSAESSPLIWSAQGVLKLQSPQQQALVVFDMLGRKVCENIVQGTFSIALPRGFYLVKTENQSKPQKVYIP